MGISTEQWRVKIGLCHAFTVGKPLVRRRRCKPLRGRSGRKHECKRAFKARQKGRRKTRVRCQFLPFVSMLTLLVLVDSRINGLNNLSCRFTSTRFYPAIRLAAALFLVGSNKYGSIDKLRNTGMEPRSLISQHSAITVLAMLLILAGDVEVNPGPFKLEASTNITFLGSLPLAAEWRDLGTRLNVPENQLTTIQAIHAHSPNHLQDCLTSMFAFWLNNCAEPTCEFLIQAVDAMGRRDVVTKLCEKYGMQGFYQGEQLPKYAPQQQTQATSIHPASQPGMHGFQQSAQMQQYRPQQLLQAPSIQFASQIGGLPKPTNKQLMEELYFTVASEWFPIGTFLEIPDGELNTIAQRCHDDPQRCLMAMLSAWLHRTNPPASWPEIVNAVQFIGRSDIAQQIQQKYCVHGLQQGAEFVHRHLPVPRVQPTGGFAPPPGHLVYPVVAQNPSFQQQHYQQTFAQFQPLYQVPHMSVFTETEQTLSRPQGVAETQTSPTPSNPQLFLQPTVPEKVMSPLPHYHHSPQAERFYTINAQSREAGQRAQQANPNGHTSPPTSEKPPFGCECGKCTFFSFLERGCPKPIASASSFPYLDLSGLTHEQQQELRGRLCFEFRQMMMKFQKFVSATILSFEQHQIPLHKLRSHVMTLGAFSPVHEGPQRPALDNHFKDLQTANTVSEIFWLLRNNLSFFNYHILEHMITVLGTEKDNENLQRYKKQFDQYAKRRMYECPPQFGTICETGYADVFVKVDSHYEMYTVTEVEILRCQLSQILHVSSQGVLNLCRVEKGCFQLTFQVPSFVQQAIFPLSSQQESALEGKGVFRLMCGKYQFIRKECKRLHPKSLTEEISDDDDSAERQRNNTADTDATGQSVVGILNDSELNSTQQDHSEFQRMRRDPEEENKTIRFKCANILKQKYRSGVPTFLTLQWPPPPTLKVFNLAMISQRELRYGADDELVRLLLKGSVSDVVSQRNEVKLEQISDSLHSKGRKVILIEGAPGAGKSTLAWHLCKMWDAGKLFQEFEIVLFVQLREPAIQSAQSLEDLFPAESLSKKKEAISAIQYCGGHQVLIVLDSWDEFSPGLDQGSIISKLICDPSNLNMQFSALIITSRPVATGRLQCYTSSRIQIAGFVQTEVKRYFTEAIKDSEMVQKLSKQLKERPIIEASCYLPLNTVIIAHIFLAQNYTLPNTLHEVFTSLVLCCIIRHMKKQGRSLKISSLDHLPLDIQEPFDNLCTLAYHGVRKNKATFSEEDLHLCNLPNELITLSLMQGVASFSTFGESRLYNFLHLSTQELLAAFYISKMQPEEQIKIFNELFEQPQFANVFKFYAAFTKFHNVGIRDTVSRIAKSKNETLLMTLLQCLYEAQDDRLCQFVASQLEEKLEPSQQTLSPVDCLSVGHFVRSVCSTTTEVFKLTLQIDKLDEYGATLLVRELQPEIVVTTEGIPNLCLKLVKGYKFIIEHGEMISKLGRFLKVLDLQQNQISRKDCVALGNGLKHCTKLEQLNLQNNHIDPEGYGVISQALKQYTNLKHLNLCGNQIGPEGCQALSNALKQCTKLEHLNLQNNHIDPEGCGVLSQALKQCTNLKHLNLRENEIGPQGCEAMANQLKHCTKLEYLSLCGNQIGPEGCQALSNALKQCTKLEHLNLWGNQIGGDGARCLSAAMEKMVNLQMLILYGNNIGNGGSAALGAALEQCRELQVLHLSYNRLTDSSVPALCELIKTAKCLKELYLRGNQFTWERKKQLREAKEERSSYPGFVEHNLYI